MTPQLAKATVHESIKDLRKNKGILEPSDYSAEIIINGSLAVIRKLQSDIAQRNQEAMVNHEDHFDILRENLSSLLRSQDSLREMPEYVEIVECFANSATFLVRGISDEDVEWTKEEIFGLLEKGNREEIISNYFIHNHKMDPFKDDDYEESNSQY